MLQRNFGIFLYYSFGLVIIVVMIFAAMKWLHVPGVGSVLDWLIGIASAWWLLFIVTVPWNIHFEARETITDAELSRKAEITVDSEDEEYAHKIARYSLILALALHVASSAALLSLSLAHITPVGYVASVAALLLTVVRPAHRLYEYIKQRLSEIRKQMKYPREDLNKLLSRIDELETLTEVLKEEIDPEKVDSWASHVEKRADSIESDMVAVNDRIQKLDLINREEHNRLEREGEKAIARISADGEFLDHVSEIIRFIKTA